ncbi:MAG: 4Fe-4S binding protein [Oscillospiraceae bacterium]|nr:4Fe-4S binding protein [Oscillospiraceae bacterium]
MKKILGVPKRLLIQLCFFLLQNPLLGNFFKGRIYQGEFKKVCTPGLNCYSCPAAVTSCPVGAFQLFLGGAKHNFNNISFFVAGFLLATGAVFGRFICGYVCPFGLFQDLLYKIKTPKLKPRFKYARYIKYVVLALFVIILPYIIRCELSGLGSPWFCEYICPAGTIFGATPLLAANELLRSLLGWRFILKAAIALAVIVSSVFVFRIFCRVLCPLGAIYSLFNRFAVFKINCDKNKCTSCGDCREACKVLLEPAEKPNSPECIRCRECVSSCKSKALK